ncbi:hypothetical protein C8R43DRAFT_143357 [Mycena crocata]|nr:hypothetical protein C8R43DRAFT_143357 [Mycena crocata]
MHFDTRWLIFWVSTSIFHATDQMMCVVFYAAQSFFLVFAQVAHTLRQLSGRKFGTKRQSIEYTSVACRSECWRYGEP